MKSITRSLLGVSIAAALLAGSTLVASCKKNEEAAAPGAAPTETKVSTFKAELPPFVPQPDPAATVVVAVDPKSGAKADLPDGAGLVVLPGATTKPSSLKMARLLNSPAAMNVDSLGSPVYELSMGTDGNEQPSGPVQVTIPLSKEIRDQKMPASRLALAHWDGSAWRPIAARIDPEKGVAQSNVSHFSSYAVVATSRFEPGPGMVVLNPPSGGKEIDRRVPRGAEAECVILFSPGATFDSVWINGIEIADASGRYKMGSGVVRRGSGAGGYSGNHFNIRVPPDAKIGEYDVEMFGKNEGRVKFPAALVVSTPMVIIIDIDGMRQDVFNGALLDPPQTYVNIPALFNALRTGAPRSTSTHRSGKGLTWEQFHSGVALTETTTIFPSVTFAGHAAIFSGTDLGSLRMAGNEWFDRRIERRFRFTIDAADTRGSYNGEDWGPLKLGGKGLANSRMHASGAKTVYERAREDCQVNSVVFHNMYYEGARWLPQRFAVGEAMYYFCPFSTRNEKEMADRADEIIQEADPNLGILTVYYAGADHHGHERSYPPELPKRQWNYLTGFPTSLPGGLAALPASMDWGVSIDTNMGTLLSAMTDVMYKETTYVFTADHGQTGMTFPRDMASPAQAAISCFSVPRSNKSLHKLSDLVFEAGFIPCGAYDVNGDLLSTTVEPKDSNAIVGLNGGLAQIYLRRPKPDTVIPVTKIGRVAIDAELKAAGDGFESWDKPARYSDVLHIAAVLAELRVGAPVPDENYANGIDLILVRNTEQANVDWMRPDYLVYISPNEQVPVIDYLKSPAGRAWMKAPHMGYRGDDRDAEMIADRIQRLQSFVSGDLLVLPHYPDFYFEYDPINGDHGSITRTDMEIPFAVARPGLTKPDTLIKGLQKTIDLQTKNRPANTDVREAVVEFLKREPFEQTPEASSGLAIVATHRNQTQTMVEFKSEQLAFMKKNDLLFRLYRGATANGPWQFVGGKYGKNAKGGSFSSPIDITPKQTVVIGDSISISTHDAQPPYYRVAQVMPGPELAEPEVYSPAFAPPEPVIELRGARTSNFDPPLGDVFVADGVPQPQYFDEWEPGMTTNLTAIMNVPDSSFCYPGAHFTITWGDGTWHAWSGRWSQDETIGYEHVAQIVVPNKLGTNTLVVRGEGVGGGVAERRIAIKYEPAWADKARQAAAKSVDELSSVKSHLPQGEEAPAKAAKLEKELAVETNEARKAELREAINHLQEEALNLEDARLTGLLLLAKASAVATNGPQAIERIGLWYHNYPDWARRYNEWVDRSIEWDLVYHASEAKERNERYRKTMRDNTKFVFLSGLEQGMKFAIRFGDYSSAKLYGLKLQAELKSLPKQRTPSGIDMVWVNSQLATAEAELGANRESAARFFPPGSNKPAWWPESSTPATTPAADDEDMKKLETDLAKRMTELQAKQKLRIKPGV